MAGESPDDGVEWTKAEVHAMLIHAQLLQDKFDTASKRVRILEQTVFLSCTCSQECVCELFEIVGYSVVSAAQHAFALVKAYDGGCLEQNLQNLLSQKPSAYRGVGLFRRHV